MIAVSKETLELHLSRLSMAPRVWLSWVLDIERGFKTTYVVLGA